MAISPIMPVGSVLDYAGATAPEGWLLCHGQAVSRTSYPTLFAVCGTTYGAGDGSTTFNFPDTLGRATIGAGTGTGLTARSRGDKLGTETHTLTPAETAIREHKHAQSPSYHYAVGFEQTSIVTIQTNNTAGGIYTAPAGAGNAFKTFADSGNVSGGQKNGSAHPIMQPSIALSKIIKAA